MAGRHTGDLVFLYSFIPDIFPFLSCTALMARRDLLTTNMHSLRTFGPRFSTPPSLAMATLFHLPREDVIFPHILLRLETIETWQLRQVSWSLWALCDEYFRSFCPTITYKERGSLETNTTSLRTCLQNRFCVIKTFEACKKLKNICLHLTSSQNLAKAFQKTCSLLMISLWHIDTACQLVSLSLVRIDCSGCRDRVIGWKTLGERCETLRELCIEDVTHFDDECLKNLTKHCTSLIKLTLKSLPDIQGIYLQHLTQASTHLEKLNVSKKIK